MNETVNDLIDGLGEQVRELSRRFAAEQLASGRRDAGSAARVAERLATLFNMAGGQVVQLVPTEEPLACGSGCGHCCHMLLLVEAPFVLWLADHLRTNLDGAAMRSLRQRMTQEGGACPLLVNNQCAAYDFRPLVCRSITSIDANACARRSAGEPVTIEAHGGQDHLWHCMANGLADAMTASGLGRDVALHFRHAMVAALAIPDASARWARGEDIFALARSPLFDQSVRIVHGRP